MAKERTAPELFWVIKNGVKMTGMPSFGLAGAPDQQIWTIVAFIKIFRPCRTMTTRAGPPLPERPEPEIPAKRDPFARPARRQANRNCSRRVLTGRRSLPAIHHPGERHERQHSSDLLRRGPHGFVRGAGLPPTNIVPAATGIPANQSGLGHPGLAMITDPVWSMHGASRRAPRLHSGSRTTARASRRFIPFPAPARPSRKVRSP